MEAKDKLLQNCIEEDETIKYLFYDKVNDTQDNVKLSILANALEISFKAGYEQAEKEFELKFNPNYLDFQKGVKVGRIAGRQAGKREVVRWIKQRSQVEHCDPDVMAYFTEYRWIDEVEWQAQLKTWAIVPVS